jgi:hypothetical protein
MNRPYADEAPMRRVAPMLIVLLAAVAVILAAVALLDRRWGPESNPAQPQAGQPAVVPALETAPQPALLDYLAQKRRQAQSYAWIDPAQHLARIPIDEAMRALAAASTVARGARADYLMGVEAPAKAQPGEDAGHPPRQRDAEQLPATKAKGQP